MEKPSEELLCAAAISGDCASLRDLLSNGADASFFDSDGMTPLMHAAAGGHADAVRCLLNAGAPWNALSPSNLSAGDLAMENGHQEVFDALLNFAIQAELVLGTIARGGGSQEEYLSERVAFGEDRIMDAESKAVMMEWEKPLMEAHARAICCSGDVGGRILNIGFGMGLVDEAIERYKPLEHTIVEAHPGVYDRMIRGGWGKKENVKIVFGKWQDVLPELGSFDDEFELFIECWLTYNPKLYIWHGAATNLILQTSWARFVMFGCNCHLQMYVGIFFDTYGEYYEDMREFHQHLHRLLKPGGVYSYFNGFCGSNAFFHVVYCQLVALELENLGYSTQFIPLPVKECMSEGMWKGVKHKYWQLDTYNLPICQALHDSE